MAKRPDFIVFDTYEKPNHAGDFALYLHPLFRKFITDTRSGFRDRIGNLLWRFKNKRRATRHGAISGVRSSAGFFICVAKWDGAMEQDPKPAEAYFLQAQQLGPFRFRHAFGMVRDVGAKSWRPR